MPRYAFILALLAADSITLGAGYNYVSDGTGEYEGYHTREWSACRNEYPQPASWPFPDGTLSGTLPNGNHWEQTGIAMGNGNAVGGYGAYVSQSYLNPPLCPGIVGWWTWRLDWWGDSTNLSYYLLPGNLSLSSLSDPHDYSDPTDALDAAVLFQWWETPIADITGDGWTDAADAGRLFEVWSGDTAPAAVPEPSGISGWFLLALPLLRQRHNV